MRNLKIYYDKEESEEVRSDIIFEPVLAGQTETKTLYLRNLLNYLMEVEINLMGDISKKAKFKISPKDRYVLNLEVTTNKNATKPINAELDIKTRSLIK